MAWDDIVFGVLTGGLYNVGKAAYKAGEAADSAGDALDDVGEAAEEAGIALAIIGSTVETLGKQLTSLLEEIEELITIKRLTPRDESDLWEEEKERLYDLRDRKTQLENQLHELGLDEPDDFSFDFWDFLTNPSEVLQKLQIISALVAVEKEINEILYQEPGVVTNAIYNAKETLERFNTIGQPKIEDILDSVDDNLEVSEEVMQEVKKLFVTKKKILLPEVEISKEVKDKLELLELDHKYYKNLLERTSTITTQFSSVLEKMPATKFDISESGVKVAGIKGNIFENAMTYPAFGSGKIDTARNTADKTPGLPDERLKDTGVTGIRKTIASDLKKDTVEFRAGIAGTERKIVKRDVETAGKLALALSRTPTFTASKLQPQGAKVSAMMSTKFDGYARNYAAFRAKTVFYDRELLKNARKIDKLKYRWEEEPGVIPRTLDELEKVLESVRTNEQPRIDTVLDTLNGNLEESKGVLERFRTEEQPRVDAVLDTLNENLEESKDTLSKINDSLTSAHGAFSFFSKYGTILKIGLGVFFGIIFLDLLIGLFVLIRLALGI